ncbi:LysR family transcriptional regulator [Streptomyces sp. NPDC001933]|uniref:LysR family transcriptional regulator n=1 Tax=Streptomyces sp. NPDC001933 TaxID=3364626 RepID=UPI0036A9909E
MELRTLEYFIAVAEERSFTKAAARCHVVQPAISQQIQALEKELGEALFERLPRQVVLTSGGAALLPHARACLAAAAAAVLEFADRSGLLGGSFALGTVGGLEGTRIPQLLGEYHRRYPRVAVSLIGASSPSLLAKVRNGEIDAAVVAGPPEGAPAVVASRVLLEDRIVAVLPAGSRAANRPMPGPCLGKRRQVSADAGFFGWLGAASLRARRLVMRVMAAQVISFSECWMSRSWFWSHFCGVPAPCDCCSRSHVSRDRLETVGAVVRADGSGLCARYRSGWKNCSSWRLRRSGWCRCRTTAR